MHLDEAVHLSNLFNAVVHALKHDKPILYRVRSSVEFYPWENIKSNSAPAFKKMLNGSFEFSIDNQIYRLDSDA